MKEQDIVRIFVAYSRLDKRYRKTLEAHLKLLNRQGIVDVWCDRCIGTGARWAKEIDERLMASHVFVLLVSSDFLASDYCCDIEMEFALQRHRDGDGLVMPVIVRPCDWTASNLGHLQALPEDGKPVTTWSNRDNAWLSVAKSIRRAAEKLAGDGLSLPN